MGGATDAWGIALSGTGVLTGCISVPSRYIHSAVGCVHLDDVEGAIRADRRLHRRRRRKRHSLTVSALRP